MAATSRTERGPEPPLYCTCLSFRTDSPELYHGRMTTTCPACGRRDVLILRVLVKKVHISQHKVPEGRLGEVQRGRG